MPTFSLDPTGKLRPGPSEADSVGRSSAYFEVKGCIGLNSAPETDHTLVSPQGGCAGIKGGTGVCLSACALPRRAERDCCYSACAASLQDSRQSSLVCRAQVLYSTVGLLCSVHILVTSPIWNVRQSGRGKHWYNSVNLSHLISSDPIPNLQLSPSIVHFAVLHSDYKTWIVALFCRLDSCEAFLCAPAPRFPTAH